MSITIPKQENHFPSPITWRGQRKRSPLHGMGLREMLLPHCWTSHQPTDPVGQRPKGIWGLVSDVQQGDRKDPKSMIQAPTKGRSGIMDCGFYGVTEIVNSLWEQSTALRESSLSQSHRKTHNPWSRSDPWSELGSWILGLYGLPAEHH